MTKKNTANDNVTKRRCSHCGGLLNYYLANDFPATEQEIAKVQAMQPTERNQEIAKRMVVMVKPKGSKQPGDYRMHPAKDFVWFMPPNEKTKWSDSLVKKVAKMLAPFARVTRAQMRVSGEYVKHIYE